MNRIVFAVIVIAVVVIILVAMWIGWRARARRDATVATAAQPPSGKLIAEFLRVMYVSTTPVSEPLTRVAAQGLRYRGRADVTVFEDGVTVEVDGEVPVHFDAKQLAGSASAARRVGKAVEHGGLALMLWRADDRELESSFRFDSRAEQQRFADALEQISQSIFTPQENAK